MPIPNTISDAGTVRRTRDRLQQLREREAMLRCADRHGDDDEAHCHGRVVDQLTDGIMADLHRLDLDGHLGRLERLLKADAAKVQAPEALANFAAGQCNG
jgi:hypothetical protein